MLCGSCQRAHSQIRNNLLYFNTKIIRKLSKTVNMKVILFKFISNKYFSICPFHTTGYNWKKKAKTVMHGIYTVLDHALIMRFLSYAFARTIIFNFCNLIMIHWSIIQMHNDSRCILMYCLKNVLITHGSLFIN